MALMERLSQWLVPEVRPVRSSVPLDFNVWAEWMTFNGNTYPITTLPGVGASERVADGFEGIVAGAYRTNGVIFACMLARFLLFSEARFQFRQMRSGRPGDLFGSSALSILETPWPNATTGDLLGRVLTYADIAGNTFVVRRGRRLRLPRPDWITIVYGSPNDQYEDPLDDLDAELLGYSYRPGGRYSSKPAVFLLPEDVAHFAPIPDPMAAYRGMSWITPVIREIESDKAATMHKRMFFENGATPNMVVKTQITDRKKFDEFVEMTEEAHKGTRNAYRTLYLGAGSDATVVGADLKQLDFKMVQGAGETRIAAAAGVPPIIVGLSEGLQSATYSNYGQARRRYADLTMRPLWRNVAGSLSTIVDVPAGSELWYDDRDIPFLAEDVKDAAEVRAREAGTIRQLIDAGYSPDAVIDAVTAGDYERLVGKHSGLYSVQLQPPMPEGPPQAEQIGRSLAALVAPYLNGKGSEGYAVVSHEG